MGRPPNCGCDDAQAPTQAPCPADTKPPNEMTAGMQMVLAMAPNAQIVVYEGGISDNVLSKIATSQTLCHQLSSSWDLAVTPITESLMAELAAQGQSFSKSTGNKEQSYILDFPNLPEVTDVGATELLTNDPGGTHLQESAAGFSRGCRLRMAIPSMSAMLPPRRQSAYHTTSWE